MSDAHKQELLTRLKTIEGHIRGIQRMVEADTYCIDMLKQTRAVRSALHRLDTLILANHLKTCVTTAIRSDEVAERERVLGELMQVYEATNKE